MSDLLDKINVLLIGDETGATTSGNVTNNTAKGHIDVVGMRRRKRKGKLNKEDVDNENDCPEGQKW